jgi:hypothetical protein
MSLTLSNRRWSRLFFSAALFNYMIGFPLLLRPRWMFDVCYTDAVNRDPMALKLWADFGFFVILIGYGYQIIARDITKNRGVVLLGIIAKLFDVVNLTTLYVRGQANPVVLLPAAIDGSYVIAFLAFYLSTRAPASAPQR